MALTYYQKNKEKLKEYSKKWNKANPEKRQEIQKKYRKKYRKQRKEYFRKWCEKNPDRQKRKLWFRNRIKLRKYKLKKGCQICGYNKCPDALEFHHLNKEDKKIIGGTNTYNHKYKDIMKEIKKCILLCSNCHKELHYNLRNKL